MSFFEHSSLDLCFFSKKIGGNLFVYAELFWIIDFFSELYSKKVFFLLLPFYYIFKLEIKLKQNTFLIKFNESVFNFKDFKFLSTNDFINAFFVKIYFIFIFFNKYFYIHKSKFTKLFAFTCLFFFYIWYICECIYIFLILLLILGNFCCFCVSIKCKMHDCCIILLKKLLIITANNLPYFIHNGG